MHFNEYLYEELTGRLSFVKPEIIKDAVDEALHDFTRRVGSIEIHKMVMAVSTIYNTGWETLYLRTRKHPIVEARQVAIYLAAKELGFSHGTIASHFGCGKENVDYTVVKIRDSISVDRGLHNAVQSAKVAYYEANPIGTEDTD